MKRIQMYLLFLFSLTAGSVSAQTYGINPMGQSGGMGGGTSLDPITLAFNETDTYEGKLRSARTMIDQGDYPGAIEMLESTKAEKESGKLYEYLGDALTADREYTKAFNAYLKGMDFYLKEKNQLGAKKMLRSAQYFSSKNTRKQLQEAEDRMKGLP